MARADDLLADAGLAADEDGDVGAGRLLDHLLDLAHLRTHEQRQLGLQALAGGLGGRGGALLPGTTGHRLDRGLQIIGGVGPADDVVGAGLDRLHDLRVVRAVGDHDHGAGLGELGRPPDEVDPGHAGQTDRNQREREAPFTEGIERLLATGHGVRRVAPVRELRDHAPALIEIALDDERVARNGGRGRGGGFEAGDLHRVSFVRTGHLSARGMPNAVAWHFTRARERGRSPGRLCLPTLRSLLPDCSKGLSLIPDACP